MELHEEAVGLPDLAGLAGILADVRDRGAYIVPMTGPRGGLLGNNGDQIMHRVFEQILERFGIRSVPADEAEIVIVPPNGALLEVYQFPELLAERIKPFLDLPLIIFPSSAYFPTRNPGFIFEGRTAPTTWILREENSRDHLLALWADPLRESGVTLELDHDVVASGHEFVPGLIGSDGGAPIVLIAARVDVEARPVGTASSKASAAPGRRSLLKRARSAVPYGRVSTFAARVARRSKQQGAGERLLASLPAEFRDEVERARGKRIYSDVSATQYATFAEYRSLIRRADLVVTNRLHVDLPATVLGKRVLLVDAGYHKLSGVYRRSLRGAANVTLVQGL